ncbi:hypothetical protein J437_LFUL018373 [Ladona fulva]|uniref:Integrase catalytic domain-containing protein n=1 Tax=Ladona fulva TaxID=123851 RepID=A0A8K0KTK6_LADFU|nr:hypothetical protein J437_LFUL018373 [Ladona fulva]
MTAYHPAGNGLVERSHRTLMSILSHFVDTKQWDWDDWLPFAISAYRSTPHTTVTLGPGNEHGTPTPPSSLIFQTRTFSCWLTREQHMELTTPTGSDFARFRPSPQRRSGPK